MTQTAARKLFATLPPRLSFKEVSERLGLDYQKARRLVHLAGYKAADGRTYAQNGKRKILPEEIDWRLSNIAIAREHGCSRERVRVIRERFGKSKVESRGRKASV